MTSNDLTRANASIRSRSRLARVRPIAKPRASRAASSMWRSRVSSSTYVQGLRRPEHAPPNVATQRGRRRQVNPAAQNIRKLSLDRREAQPNARTGLELDEHVDVAVVAEIIPHRRPEE